ncbi:CatB-related O-acetyltransferase [Pseudomonas sp. UBA2684]|uniref:CatB-related O-acetyltransferase n=1 Tax=Pseudomonas sp. UBA2684 TaxID=1947311 RepID=UPI000E7EA2ED|nr:CatB-related O-acetyltransferase [Pseudomonas sp. UBA2684]HBX57093.1 acetyltransferase [Pseudomonas sp.]|tara:strand:- start:11760 stop:12392 length:633 start_codon:yes stop_codon:yes gene_type:complete
MRLLKTLEQHLRKSWKSWRGAPELPRFLRPQARFRERYPTYQIGIGTYGMPVVHDWQEDSTLIIGSYCSIADNVQIFLGGQHRVDWVSTYPFPAYLAEAAHIEEFGGSRGDVVIGSDVWLCANTTILSGVTIGHGAVIGSGAVISRDVEPYAVMVGNPAQRIRWRFDEEIRDELLKTAWWEWPEAEIRRVVDKLCSDDITAFLAYARSRA